MRSGSDAHPGISAPRRSFSWIERRISLIFRSWNRQSEPPWSKSYFSISSPPFQDHPYRSGHRSTLLRTFRQLPGSSLRLPGVLSRHRSDMHPGLLHPLKRSHILFQDQFSVSLFFAISVTLVTRPARDWISDGMMIFVALPSAAFANASRLFNCKTA